MQLASVGVSTNGKNKQVEYSYANMLYIYKVCPKSVQAASKCWDDKNQMPKISNLPNT